MEIAIKRTLNQVKRMTEIERFMAKVTKTESCWVWTAGIGSSGYGRFWCTGGVTIPAHWYLLDSRPGPGFEACHHCDNKRCVRPSHIFIGTRSDNMNDCVRKGRHGSYKGWRHTPERLKTFQGVNNVNAKLDDKKAALAMACPTERGAAVKMASILGISLDIVCRIRSRKRWKHVPEPDDATRRLAINLVNEFKA